MSAVDKNGQAFKALLGDGSLAEQLERYRIGVYSAAESETPAGHLLAEATAEVLARLWPNIEATGPLEETFAHAGQRAAASGALSGRITSAWSPPYTAVIALGCTPPIDSGPYVQVGADDWIASVGAQASCGHGTNPVGPAGAAALAGAELFKLVFADHLRDFEPLPISDLSWDFARLSEQLNPIAAGPLHFDQPYLFGLGAVTHGMVWILERWPERVDGVLHLVEHDNADASNGQRYVGLRAEHWNRAKAEVVRQRLQARHGSLDCRAHVQNLNDYCESLGHVPEIRLAVCGLDSAETRRHVALKLPRRALNMWTDRHHVGAARFGSAADDGWPCLFCAYPEERGEVRAEFAVIASQTGLAPSRVRALLDGDGLVTPADSPSVASRLGVAADSIVGRPLRSILQQLCATGRVAVQPGGRELDVPFAFSSMLAGVLGFVELVRELRAEACAPYRLAYNVMKYPSLGVFNSCAPRRTCYVCGDGTN